MAAVLLYFALRGLDWAAFWSTVKGGHYEFLLLTIPLGSANYFIRGIRWTTLVRSEGSVPVMSVFWANMVGYLGNAYLPARAGELLRSVLLGRQSGLGTSFVLATAFTERLMDVIALVIIGSGSLLVQATLSSLLASALRAMALVSFLALAVAVAAPFHEKTILRVAGWIPLPVRMSAVLSQQLSRFILGMRSLQNGRRLLSFILLTGAIWLLDAYANTIGVRVISQHLTIPEALIFLAALGLSSAIPSTPGSLGIYQFIAVAVLVPFGLSRAEALAYILLSQITNYAVITFWGLVGLWKLNRRP